MDSALTPREIQARIRSGETLEDVAKDAGVPADQIEVYAAPVIAERDHVAGTALTCPVRRTGESSSARPLRAVVAERLQQRTIDVDDVTWDAWRDPDRRWTVTATYQSGSATHQGEFTFDLRGRFSVARNDEARWLIGETTPAHGPQPGRKRKDPDTEPTVDLNDELALVRVIQRHETVDEPADYAEVELAEVDGVYDIVPSQTDMDVLYDMLSSFNEDSVNIYAGLTRPVVDDDPIAEPAPVFDEVAQSRAEEQEAVEEQQSAEDQAEPVAEPSVDVEEPQQDSLLEPEQEPTLIRSREELGQSAPKPKSRGRKRAAVPSWDEIMFGSPQKNPNKD